MGSDVPGLDAGTRQRLTARFGSQAEAWFGELPGVLAAVAQRWQLAVGFPIPRGSVSAVYWCRMADGQRAVLKASPDRARPAFEAAALGAWRTVHTPAVIALDEQLGVLVLEAIEPGTPLDLWPVYPAADGVAGLLSSLHQSGVPDPSYPGAAQRVAYLFAASAKLYDRHPELTALIPRESYQRGHQLAAAARGSRLCWSSLRRRENRAAAGPYRLGRRDAPHPAGRLDNARPARHLARSGGAWCSMPES